MKKLILLGCLLLCLTGCNRQIIDTTYSYDRAYCYYGNKEIIYEIDSWKDYEGEQIQIKNNDGTYLITMNQCYLWRK